MPTYHIHDTTVKLCVWNPHHPPKVAIEHHSQTPLIPIDSAFGRAFEPLEEEYFDGQSGVDFLGSDMPFFLVKSGKGLFSKTEVVSKSVTEAVLDHGQVQSTAEEVDDDCDSTLSTVSSSRFANSSPVDARKSAAPINASGEPRAWEWLKPKCKGEEIVPKPITSATPLKIQVELSRKSHLRSLSTNQRLDLCVSVFINGDFQNSRVLRLGTRAEERNQTFGGRRIDTYLEAPWVVLPMSQIDAPFPDKPYYAGSSFEDRWGEVNRLLLKEADQWGRTGKYDMFRSPVGEYLAELSKKPVPERKDKTTCKAGIIDVVISYGISIKPSTWSMVARPQRKLPEAVCGKEQKLFVVPEELTLRHKGQLIAEFENEDKVRHAYSSNNRSSRTQRTGDDYYFSTVTTKKFPDDHGTDGSTTTVTMELQGEPSSSQPIPLVKPSQLQRGGSLPTLHPSMPQQGQRTHSTPAPATPTREHPRHSNKPQVTPQKSYKGASPQYKTQKQNPWEFLPFDSEKLVAHSTRSQRSPSIPASSPENLRGQELVDSYLTLRNRQLGALPPTLFGHPTRSSLDEDAVHFTPSASSEVGSSQCKPSTRSDRRHESSSKLHDAGEVLMAHGPGLDGAGEGRKRGSDSNAISENTPTGSSKRQRLSSGSPNTSLESNKNCSTQLLRSSNRVISKSGEGSGDKNSVPEQVSSHTRSSLNVSQSEEFTTARDESADNRPQERNNIKQRRPSRAVSARELSSVLTPHKPTLAINTSFGASFAEASSSRSTRNPTTRLDRATNEEKAKTSQANALLVTATYKAPVLSIKGIDDLTQNDTTRKIAQNAVDTSEIKNSQPPSHAKEKNTTPSRTKTGRLVKAQKQDQILVVNIEQKGAESLTTPVNVAKESPKTQEKQQMTTTRSSIKVQATRQNAEEYIDKPEASSPTSMNPKFSIDSGYGTTRSSGPPQKSSQRIKTPTSGSAFLMTPKDVAIPSAFTPTGPSSATVNATPETGSTVSFRETGSPSMVLADQPRSLEALNPVSRRPPFPPQNPVQTPVTRSSATRPVAPVSPTTPNASSSSSIKKERPPNPSVSADLAWKPNYVCAHSVLSYATDEMIAGWSEKEYISSSGSVYRVTKAEREGVFRASGILMGVRFVVGVKADDTEDETEVEA